MIDLRLYNPTGVYNDVFKISETMQLVQPDDANAKSIEVIAGKVVKYMLTEKGTDAFNSDYGSISMHYLQMSQTFIPQFKREVLADLESCFKFLKQAEMDQGVSGERLESIKLLKVVYNPRLTPNRVDVYIEIVTTLGKRAVVSITPRTSE